ncbi:MAG: O-antigen ligase family protein [Cytophagales bacterium]|nr:O-antigen ligase family protein [Cytophagales bacterium]
MINSNIRSHDSLASETWEKSLVGRLVDYCRGQSTISGWFMIILLGLITLIVTLGVYKLGLLGAILFAGVVVVGPLVFTALWKTQVGIYIMVIASFFLSVALRLVPNIPVGIGLDLMILIMVSGNIYKMQYERNWTGLKSPLTVILMIWVVYNLAQVANPYAASRVAWFYVIRPAVGYLMLYFLVWQAMVTSKDSRRLFNFVLFLSAIAGLWGIYQGLFGYFGWEMSHVIRTDTIHLVFNNGRWRAFGPIGSPAQYGIIMAAMCCLSLNTAFGSREVRSKVIYLLIGCICLLAMVFSGTRSSFIIIPIYYFIKVVISRNRKLWVSLVFAGMALGAVAKMPTSNYHILRIQSVFKASEDKSYQIRANNRKMITPWIMKHPIGGGLGSTGVWGQRFSPGTFLANFPPDSGVIRVAVELGWIGLIIFLLIYFIAFLKGVMAYWRMPDSPQKAQVAGMLCMLPPLGVVEIGQEVAGVFPMSLLFWVLLGLLFVNIRHSKNQSSKQAQES